ncbi:MAG TPA: polyprenyl synthetase family protein [Gaiellaceae bacterium]|jgi:geranylgeranyl diphosphate synthase type II|nr:polyprenyl synthetase family protein [Gaiellaceae bacterium]
MPRAPEKLRALVEDYLDELELTPELGTLAEPIRHALGGKRVRPVLCLASGEAVGAPVESLLPAAAGVELVHSFSLVHDDLPSLDNDAERRGRPSVWAAYGEATAILAGDALLAEAFRLALSYPRPDVARELVTATLAMIGGQQLDLTDGWRDLETLHALKTGALFSASVMCGLWAAELPEREHPPWRAFAAELGLLFQIVDDILDGDGYVREVGAEEARRLADRAGERAQARLAAIDADTSTLSEIVAGLVARTS